MSDKIKPNMIACEQTLHDNILAVKIYYGYKSMNQAIKHIYDTWFIDHGGELNEPRTTSTTPGSVIDSTTTTY